MTATVLPPNFDLILEFKSFFLKPFSSFLEFHHFSASQKFTNNYCRHSEITSSIFFNFVSNFLTFPSNFLNHFSIDSFMLWLFCMCHKFAERCAKIKCTDLQLLISFFDAKTLLVYGAWKIVVFRPILWQLFREFFNQHLMAMIDVYDELLLCIVSS